MKPEFKILVVDDEEDMCDALRDLLSFEDYLVETTTSSVAALKKYQKKPFDVVITDIVMPRMDGIELLEEIKKIDPEAIVIMITGYSSVENAVQALKLGAEDFFTKPFKNVEILKVINRVHQNFDLKYRAELLKQAIRGREIPELIGESAKIQKVKSDIRVVANSDVPVFITGESGTGKELVAKAIHQLSSRQNETFVPINCASVPKDLLENEFFGHEKGSFSGATKQKYGLFEVANNGTIFLDEIAEMPLLLQSKILRTVETQLLRRIGGTTEIPINIRIICSTNRDIKQEIKADRFRKDLYFRLNTFEIRVPPLRDWKEDIPLLVDNYVRKQGLNVNKLPEKIISAFNIYEWPGNVRELEHILERMILLSAGKKLEYNNLPSEFKLLLDNSQSSEQNIKNDLPSLEEIEKVHILKAMKHYDGNKVKTAEILGIGLKTLYRKLNNEKD